MLNRKHYDRALALVRLGGALVATSWALPGCGGEESGPSVGYTDPSEEAGTATGGSNGDGGGASGACSGGETQCGLSCVSTETHHSHCGACDVICSATEICVQGLCQFTSENGAGGAGSTGGSPGTGGMGTVGGTGGVGETGGATGTFDDQVPLYRTFERAIENETAYSNRFADVELEVTYTSPSGRVIEFFGFFDGDGNGSGDAEHGNVWKLRFMPDELGDWRYSYRFSDGSLSGEDGFSCLQEGAGKGILRPYQENPRWLAYNGTEPVWLKSYYETGHAAIAQPLDWVAQNVYQPMLDRGYNHLQVNWLLPLCCDDQYYIDGPAKSIDTIRLYSDGEASSTMQLNVWYMLEEHVRWLNNRNVGLHMFLGFDGGRNDGPAWDNLSGEEKLFYVRYVVARLGPFANIAGWNFVWEVPGDRESHELGLARLLMEEDVFEHLRTYEDEMPSDHEYQRPEYNFAAIENHGMVSSNRDEDRDHWREPWTHHEASLVSYVEGKPVYMSEGNALWRRYWQQKTGATPDDLRRSAWGCATAGASFNWNGHLSEEGLRASGADGLPFSDESHPYAPSARHLDILGDVLTERVAFYEMTPQDSLLSNHDDQGTWCLAEPGQQYLVFSTAGDSFRLNVSAGNYDNNAWVDTRTGEETAVSLFTSAGEQRDFVPPNTSSDWVLVLRAGP